AQHAVASFVDQIMEIEARRIHAERRIGRGGIGLAQCPFARPILVKRVEPRTVALGISADMEAALHQIVIATKVVPVRSLSAAASNASLISSMPKRWVISFLA